MISIYMLTSSERGAQGLVFAGGKCQLHVANKLLRTLHSTLLLVERGGNGALGTEHHTRLQPKAEFHTGHLFEIRNEKILEKIGLASPTRKMRNFTLASP